VISFHSGTAPVGRSCWDNTYNPARAEQTKKRGTFENNRSVHHRSSAGQPRRGLTLCLSSTGELVLPVATMGKSGVTGLLWSRQVEVLHGFPPEFWATRRRQQTFD